METATTPPAPPQRRTLDFRDFDAVLADVDALAGRGYDRAGNWNLAQVCDHLAKSMAESIDGFSFKFPLLLRWVPPLIRWWFKKRIFGKRTFPSVSAPDPLKPADVPDEADALARFRREIARVRTADKFARSPFFGWMTAEEWRDLHLVHASHHLGFLVPR